MCTSAQKALFPNYTVVCNDGRGGGFGGITTDRAIIFCIQICQSFLKTLTITGQNEVDIDAIICRNRITNSMSIFCLIIV